MGGGTAVPPLPTHAGGTAVPPLPPMLLQPQNCRFGEKLLISDFAQKRQFRGCKSGALGCQYW
jgi:hypothetical protein